MDFIPHIRDLLLEHDCVILPGLGGFVGNYRPARINESRQTASPPSKQILFNPSLVHNDGLLYGHISRVSGQDYKEVQEQAGRFIDTIRRTVQGGQKFDMEGIGYFYAGKDRRLRFEADENANFLPDSYGLPYLQYRVFDVPAALRHVSATAGETRPVQQRIRRWVYAATAACILGAMVLIPIRNGSWDMAGLDAIQGRSPASISGTAGTEVQPASIRSGEATQTASTSPPAAVSLTGSYHIIVGSFRDFGNARQLFNQLDQQGYEARILSAPGAYFRVSARQLASMEEAQNALHTLRDEFDAAWLLRN